MKAAFEDWQRRKLDARITPSHSQLVAPSSMQSLAQSARDSRPGEEPAQSRSFPQERERHLRGINEARKLAQSTIRKVLEGQTPQAAQAERSSHSKPSFGATQHGPSAKRLLHISTSDRQPIITFSLAIQERPVPGFVRTGEIPPYPVRQLPAYHLAGGGRYVMSSCYFDPPLEPRQALIRAIHSSTTFSSREPPTCISINSESDSRMLENIYDCESPTYISSDSESHNHMKKYISGSQSDIDEVKDTYMLPHHHPLKDTSKNEYPFIPDEYSLDFGDHCGKHISQMYSRHFDYILWLKSEGVHRQRPELGEAIAKYERENFPAPEDYAFTFGTHEDKKLEQVPERYLKYLKGKGGEKLLDKHPGLRDALEWFGNKPLQSGIADVTEAVITSSKKGETREKISTTDGKGNGISLARKPKTG